MILLGRHEPVRVQPHPAWVGERPLELQNIAMENTILFV